MVARRTPYRTPSWTPAVQNPLLACYLPRGLQVPAGGMGGWLLTGHGEQQELEQIMEGGGGKWVVHFGC